MHNGYPNLKDIEVEFTEHLYETIGVDVENIKYYAEFDFSVFPQTWASTALGFGGIGGQAMTKAYTTVITMYYDDEIYYGVFFDGRLAYVIDNPTDEFFEDLYKRKMKSVMASGVYYKR